MAACRNDCDTRDTFAPRGRDENGLAVQSLPYSECSRDVVAAARSVITGIRNLSNFVETELRDGIDEPWRHPFARRVDPLRVRGNRDVGSDRHDLSNTDEHGSVLDWTAAHRVNFRSGYRDCLCAC